MKMKNIAIALLAATFLSSSAYSSDTDVVATYSDGSVTEAQVMEQFGPSIAAQTGDKNKKFSDLDKNVQEALVRGYVNVKLLDKEVEKAGIRKSKEFQDKLKLVEKQIAQQEYIESYLKSVVTDSMIENEYTKLAAELKGKEEVKTSHILVETEEKAKEVKKKLSKGAKFSELAKEFSKDDGSKSNGGEIGYVIKGQLVPEFENKAFAMKKNEISEPVKTQFGWHIIKLLDKRPVSVPPKDQAIPALKNKLAKEAAERHMLELADKANFQIKLSK